MAADRPYKTPLEMVAGAHSANQGSLTGMGKYGKLSDIDFTRWNKLYPYALVLAEAKNGGTETSYTEKARFILPIPPDQLQIQTPFAIQTTKTLGGVVEEHNGVPFKMIMASGTTGTFPLRGSTVPNGGPGIFGGAIQAATQDVANQNNTAVTTSFDDSALRGTGYGQFRILKVFLEGYARRKKAGERDLRLLFVPFKEQVAYVVTPVSFNMRREAGKALKYRYDLQLKAWHEFPSSKLGLGLGKAAIRSFDELTGVEQLLAAVETARKTLATLKTVVQSVRSAVVRVLNILREVAFFIKEMAGVALAVIDLPAQIIRDCKAAFYDIANIIRTIGDDLDASTKAYLDLFPNKSNNSNKTVYSWDINSDSTPPPSPNPLDEVFDNPNSELAQQLFSLCRLDMLQTSTALQAKIDSEIERVRSLTRADFAAMRAEMQAAITQIADSLGASDATYDATYRNIHTPIVRTPTQAEYEALYALNDAMEALQVMSAQPEQRETTSDYIAGLASKSGIAFQQAVSKYAIPFPFDFTLEDVARRYLGDVDRWMEIAALNGLRAPYVDEVGFTRVLISNGSNSEITIADATNLMIGQPVWLQSNFVNREKRHILNINEVGPGNVVLTLDGDADLDKFHTAAAAYLHAFLPYTINSHQMLYIPSNEPTTFDSELAKIPGVDAFDSLLEVGGVDMLLTADNDLAITPDGDCRLAYGMQALIQKARITLSTPKGTLIRHPDFGLPIKTGQSIADLDMQDLKQSLANVFESDPSFEGIVSSSINAQGATLGIDLSIAVTGQEVPIPVSFLVRK